MRMESGQIRTGEWCDSDIIDDEITQIFALDAGLYRITTNTIVEKSELEKQEDSNSHLTLKHFFLFFLLLFSFELITRRLIMCPLKKILKTISRLKFLLSKNDILNVAALSAGFIAGELCTGLLDFCLAW